MLTAIRDELLLQHSYLDGELIETIYFGGGTPSLLPAGEIDLILSQIRKTYYVSADPEITLEANPDDLTPEKLEQLFASGVNRLSIGIQAFDDSLLKLLNRAHDSSTAKACVGWARAAGFTNLSIDLIYAIPGQTMLSWSQTIDEALKLNPEHISAYNLTVEPRTAFGNWHSKGKFTPVDEDDAAAQLQLLIDRLTAAGYDHYEISNFGKPGFYSRHNTSYWRQKKFLGVGPSAHSFNGVVRQYNVSNNFQYIRSVSQGVVPGTEEVLSREDNINDYLMTSLRTQWGCDLDHLRTEFNYDLPRTHSGYLERLSVNGLAFIEHNFLKLTTRGKFLADRISVDLFVAAPERF